MLAGEFDCIAGVFMSFNAEVNDIDQVTKQVKISIPPETFSKEFNTGIVELMKTSKVNGFRAGKAPRQIVERQHGERIKFEVANRLISKTLFETIRERSIDMIGDPDIDVPSIEPGKELNFTAKISVFPKPEIEGYDAVAVEVQRRDVAAADVDGLVEKLRESKATTKKIETRSVAQEGDVVDASLTVRLESEAESSRPEPLQIQIGKEMLPPELDSGIVGMSIGEEKIIEGKVPESHRDKELRGQPATYTVTLNGISEKVLPEFDDAFVESLEREAKTVSELRADLTKQLETENKKALDNDAQVAILDKLTEKNEFLVPQILIDQEIRSLLVRFGMVNPQQVDVEKVDVTRFREGLREIAIKRVRGSIIVDRVVEKEKLTVTAEEFDKWCTDFALENKHGVEDVKRYFSNKERLAPQMAEIAREKGLEFLRSRAKITLVDKVEEAPSAAEVEDSGEKEEKKKE